MILFRTIRFIAREFREFVEGLNPQKQFGDRKINQDTTYIVARGNERACGNGRIHPSFMQEKWDEGTNDPCNDNDRYEGNANGQ